MTDRELLQQALDALGYPCIGIPHTLVEQVSDALRARLAQPEQEPICVAFIRTRVGIDKNGIEIWKDEPVYATPLKREWVGLTDEERYLNEARSAEEIEYAKAIEAKLKEKNYG